MRLRRTIRIVPVSENATCGGPLFSGSRTILDVAIRDIGIPERIDVLKACGHSSGFHRAFPLCRAAIISRVISNRFSVSFLIDLRQPALISRW